MAAAGRHSGKSDSVRYILSAMLAAARRHLIRTVSFRCRCEVAAAHRHLCRIYAAAFVNKCTNAVAWQWPSQAGVAGLMLRRPRLATGCNGYLVLGGLERVITRRSVWRRGVAAARPPGCGSGPPGVEGAFRCNGSEGVFGNLRVHDS